MAKELMNEAERFLLERWGEARLLEETMEGIRTKYKGVFQRIIDAVKDGHPELDTQRSYPTQFLGCRLHRFRSKVMAGGRERLACGSVGVGPTT